MITCCMDDWERERHLALAQGVLIHAKDKNSFSRALEHGLYSIRSRCPCRLLFS